MEIAIRESHLPGVVIKRRTRGNSPTNENLGYESFPPDLVQLQPTLLFDHRSCRTRARDTRVVYTMIVEEEQIKY